jgi:NADH-quinone oxidoreductase subunit N
MPSAVFNPQHLSFILPEIFIALSAMALLLLGVFIKDGSEKNFNIIMKLSALVLFASVLLLLPLIKLAPELVFSNMLVIDDYASLMKIILVLGGASVMLMSIRFMIDERMYRFEYPVLILFSILGMMLMLSANSLLMMYVALELQALPLYILAAWRRDYIKSTEAGLKYFVLGALSSGIMLLGMSYIYGVVGSLEFASIEQFITQSSVSPMLMVGMAFVMAGMAFKLAAAPFHMWSPDVYEGAPTPVTAFFAIVPKIAAAGLFIRLCYSAFGGDASLIYDQNGPLFSIEAWQQIAIAIAVLSMIVGAVGAIAQNNIKRLLAYSSIGHIGFVILAIATGSKLGIQYAILYMIVYMITSLGVFALVLALRRDENEQVARSISDLAGIAKPHPLPALAMTIFMLSMAGIPFLAGFFAKFFVLQAVVNAGMVWLAVVAVLASVIAAYYYLRIIKIMYFDEMSDKVKMSPLGSEKVIVIFAAVFCVLFMLVITPVSHFAKIGAASFVLLSNAEE